LADESVARVRAAAESFRRQTREMSDGTSFALGRIGELGATLAEKTREIAATAARTNDVRDELRQRAEQLTAALDRASSLASERSAEFEDRARGVGTAADLAGER